MANTNDDPIFSLPGNLAINWWYDNNGARIALTGGHLSRLETPGNMKFPIPRIVLTQLAQT